MASQVLSQAASHRFVTSTEQLHNGAPVISVTGEVDRATAPTLEQALLGVAQDQTGAVILDLTGCSFLDSRGVKVLLATRVHLERSDRPLALVLSDPSVLRIFRIMQVDSLFDIYPSIGAIPDHNDNNGKGNTKGDGMDNWRERETRTQARSRQDNGSTAHARTCAHTHENSESERLVEEHERFAVVEEVSGEATKLARRSDPRHWHGQRDSGA